MLNRTDIQELLTLLENTPPAVIAGCIIAGCLLLAINAIRQSGRVRRIHQPRLLNSREMAAWDRLSHSRRMHH